MWNSKRCTLLKLMLHRKLLICLRSTIRDALVVNLRYWISLALSYGRPKLGWLVDPATGFGSAATAMFGAFFPSATPQGGWGNGEDTESKKCQVAQTYSITERVMEDLI